MFDLSLGHLGSGMVMLAFVLALYAIVVGVIGALRRDARLITSARYTAVAVFLAATAAIVTMEAALLTDDFSIKYVAEHSQLASPLWIKIVTLWSALEGSILLWAWLLTGYTAVVALTTPNTPLRPWALNVMQVVQVFFLFMVAFVANPFIVLPFPPADGPGANPLLQNHWMMAVHPVLLYLGYVGLTVPFAFAMAALITRRPGTEWMRLTRRWTLAGWGFLTAGIIAGGWWSYEVLGWGGYWAWDPVENVSIMPWLVTTAFIHSVQVQERRRMLKSWNILLVILAFSLSILGTFLIRSGVISSVHAFGDGPVGPYFLTFFGIVALASFALVALRWDQVRDTAELDAVVSREGGFLAGNVLFLAMTFAVLLGTLFPLIVEAVTGDKVTVGAPFFDQVSIPLWLLAFLLMGIGPLLPWRKAPEQSVIRNLAWMLGAGLLTAIIAFLLGIHKVYPLITIGLAGYNLMSVALLIAGAVLPRARLSRRSFASVFTQYAFENKRRFGSMFVHFGVIVIALGIVGSGGYRVDEQIRLEQGRFVNFQGYDLRFVDIDVTPTPVLVSETAYVEVHRNGRLVTVLEPKLNIYPRQTVVTPGVLYTPWHDIYLSIVGLIQPGDTSVVIRAVQSPLVTWIWIGGIIMALGTGYALTPARRTESERQLAGQVST